MRGHGEKTFEKVGFIVMVMFWVLALAALSQAARGQEITAAQPQQQATSQKPEGQKKAVTRKAIQTKKTTETQAQQPSPEEQVTLTRFIVVSIPDRQLALIDNGEVVKVYPVAVGKDSSPSPDGNFTVVKRTVNPTYYHEGQIIPPGKDNPVGTRWIGLSEKGYGIHGTNAPKSIGKAASHGCIRMAKKDIEELFTLVKVGDLVTVRSDRDDLVAQVFHADTLVASNSGDVNPGEVGNE